MSGEEIKAFIQTEYFGAFFATLMIVFMVAPIWHLTEKWKKVPPLKSDMQE